MASSLRCKVSGCDLDECGICRRCGSESKANHAWTDADRTRPCFVRKACERCDAEKESPDHDWEMTKGEVQDTLTCTRCGMAI